VLYLILWTCFFSFSFFLFGFSFFFFPSIGYGVRLCVLLQSGVCLVFCLAPRCSLSVCLVYRTWCRPVVLLVFDLACLMVEWILSLACDRRCI